MSETEEGEWQKICADTATKMIGHIQPHLTSISRILSETEGEHLGSGSYLEIEGKKYIVTNEHVAKHLATHSLTHQFFGNENTLKLTKPAITKLSPVDVAFIEIPNLSWFLFDHSALEIPSDRFAAAHNPAESECLFFAGYSGERSKFLFGHLMTPVTPYLTQERPFPSNVREADPDFHFALFYPPDLATSVDGTSHLPNPHGFSGSLVWDTKRVACLSAGIEWNPEMAKITGIVWGWSCILVTKVEHLKLENLIFQEIESA